MADWSKPTITSNYVTFVDEVKARDVDAITLQVAALVGPPANSVKMVRLAAPLIKFQEYIGAAFVDRVLSPEGGGTGVTSIAGLIPSLGLGTMAYQNSNNISVSGGYMNSVRIDNPTMYGTIIVNGAFSVNGANATFTGSAGAYTAFFVGSLTAPSYGVMLRAGTGSWDEVNFASQNAAGNVGFFTIRGHGGVYVEVGLKIPVGVNKYLTQ